MKVCFPVLKANGLESEVHGHFGSAPFFLVVETDSNNVVTINNTDQHHSHGACSPMKALGNQRVDAVVVGGIGTGALIKLNQSGVRVFQAKALTVIDNINILKTESLPEFSSQNTCGGHGHGKGCGH